MEFNIEEIRKIRNSLLVESDWTQLEDTQLTHKQRDAWKAYRQRLRDLTNSISDSDFEEDEFGNKNFIGWPEKPSS